MAETNMDGIDLYADVDDFGRDAAENFHENDLYDDVITSRNDIGDEPARPAIQPTVAPSGNITSGKKFSLYVGNLTWWTTDQDLQDALASIGVTDLITIKFHENRTNGQSKGFATVVVGSESSSRLMLDRLVQKDLHGMLPSVSYCTTAALHRLDPTAKKDNINSSTNQRSNNSQRSGQSGSNQTTSSSFNQQSSPHGSRLQGPPPPGLALGPPPLGPLQSNGGPPPRQMMTGPGPQQIRPPMSFAMPGHGPPPTIIHMAPPRDAGVVSVPPPRGPPMLPPGPGMILVDPRLPPPPRTAWVRPPDAFSQPPPTGPGVGMFGGPPPMSVPPPGGAMVPVASGPPTQLILNSGLPPPGHPLPSSAAHINPAFLPPPPTSGSLPPAGTPMFPSDPYGRGPPSSVYSSPMDSVDRHRPPPVMDRSSGDSYNRRQSPERERREPPVVHLSETEFEEILQRNKTVSSSAISRAVQDASSGDYGSAIETLVTAVSLIKQSKIANDDRCKILISSLQDTLHGIELKSYGSKTTSSRERRSRSPRDREPSERSRSRQQRSRSREYLDRDDRHQYREAVPRERSHERSREPVIMRERSRERSRERDPYERSSRSDLAERSRGDSRRYESDRHRVSEREYATSTRASRH